MGGGYEQVGSSKDVTNVNPMTAGLYSGIQGQQSQLWNQLMATNPSTIMGGLGQQAGAIGGIAGGLMGPYAASANAAATAQAQQNVLDVLNQYSMGNALHSGAADIGAQGAAAIPFLQAQANLAQMQSGLAGQLAGGYLNSAQQQYSMLGGLFGQNQGILGGMGAPSWYEPTYAYKPGFMDYAAPMFGAAAGAFAGGAFGGFGGGGMSPSWIAAMGKAPTTQY